jgi:Zn-dependent metalloprotease
LQRLVLTLLITWLVASAATLHPAAQSSSVSLACGCTQTAQNETAGTDDADELTKPTTGILPGALVQRDALTGFVRRAKGHVPVPTGRTAAEAARYFLKKFRRLFAPMNSSEELRQVDDVETTTGNKITYARFINGLPVFGEQIAIFVDRSHAITLVNSELYPLRQTSFTAVTATIGAEEAANIAINCVRAKGSIKDTDIRPSTEKGLFVARRSLAVSVWRIKFDTREPLGAWEVLVEVRSGKVVWLSNVASYKVIVTEPILSWKKVA